mmetsp:Transcript_28080/g.51300  ORF Transcript_28080/g.51300 Transcript_28080/m.51300 type:complete len:782 (+) Transcript_28080:51-2396(+)
MAPLPVEPGDWEFNRLAPTKSGTTKSLFEGVWQDAEGSVMHVVGNKVMDEKGNQLDFAVTGARTCVLKSGGKQYDGEITSDGRILWNNDGSTWQRQPVKEDAELSLVRQEQALDLKSQEAFQMPARKRKPMGIVAVSDKKGYMEAQGKKYELSKEAMEYYNRYASGGVQSMTERSIEIQVEGTDERFVLGASTSTKVHELKEMLVAVAGLKSMPGDMRIKRNRGAARTPQIQKDQEEAASKVIVSGLPGKSLTRPAAKLNHPIAVIGGGLGGLQTALVFMKKGRQDLTIIERHGDFGGHSWITVANKFTKLQTETGTYSLEYGTPGTPHPRSFSGGTVKYPSWPSRDTLLIMFREQAAANGMYEKAMFNTSVEKVAVRGSDLKSRSYALHTISSSMSGEDVLLHDDSSLFMAGAVSAWPGNLCLVNRIEWPGEEDFDGYIEYSSFDKVDYNYAQGRNVILYGHGAFTIENVRTLVEHRCKKVYVMCRKRNLCGMKMVSWMVHWEEQPVPGNIMLEAFQKMYDLVDFNVWGAFSVKTDEKRSWAMVEQKTVFGVTDVYFLAGYYGLMEVVVDEIKRLEYHRAHCIKGRKLDDVEMIIKAVGTLPDHKTDKILGLKELVGFWVNGDPLRPVSCNGMFVQAQNFGSFSSGPGFAGLAALHAWFIEYPDDMDIILDGLPKNKPGEKPGYVPPASHFLPAFMTLNSRLPAFAMDQTRYDNLKAKKHRIAHPLEQHLAEVKGEWEMYIKYFKANKMVDDRPEPPYPYTKDMMEDFMARSRKQNSKGK